MLVRGAQERESERDKEKEEGERGQLNGVGSCNFDFRISIRL